MDFFAIWPAALFILVGLLGLLVGSFLNVVAHRLPIMMELDWRRQCDTLAEEPSTVPDHARQAPYDLWRPGSACPSCNHPISPWQNIPIVSYLVLGGRCKHCAAAISARYPVIEAAAGMLGLLVAWRFGPTAATAAALGFCWALLVLAVIDIDRQLLPDSITLPLLWAGLILGLFNDGNGIFVDSSSSIVGAVAGYLSLWLVYQVFKLVTGKEGMGYGDFKLLAAIGAWVGWQVLPLVILLSALVGSVVGIAMIVLGGRGRQTPIPFGPYLAAAGLIALLWGDGIMGWYAGW